MRMLRKVQLYQQSAHRKEVFTCTPILNPCLKLTTIRGSTLEEPSLGKTELIEYFTGQARKFKPVVVHHPEIKIFKQEDRSNFDLPNHFIKHFKTVPVDHEVKEY